MSQPVVLLVESDQHQAGRIARALEQLALPGPVHLSSGEEAADWVGANRCDVCLLDYHLPGSDGLATLRELRRRQPGLPVVMLLGVYSAPVAGAALHAGAVACVPKTDGYPRLVAQLAQRLARSAAPGVQARASTAEVLERLSQPTYQNRLRVIGRHLDLGEYRAIHLVEVGGSTCHPGFLVRALPRGGRAPEALEFLDRDFSQRVARAIAARGEGERRRSTTPLLPTGYEDFLRALGYRLDLLHAEAVTVAELDGFVAVGGVRGVQGSARIAPEPFQELMRPEEITELLDEAFRRRGVSAQAPEPAVLAGQRAAS